MHRNSQGIHYELAFRCSIRVSPNHSERLRKLRPTRRAQHSNLKVVSLDGAAGGAIVLNSRRVAYLIW